MAAGAAKIVVSALFGQPYSRVLDIMRKDKILWREHETQLTALKCNIVEIERYGDAFILDDDDICSWYSNLQDAMYAAIDVLDAYTTAVAKGRINSLKDRFLNILYTISIHQVESNSSLTLARTVELLNDKIDRLLAMGQKRGYQDQIDNERKKYPKLRPKPTHKPFGDLPIIGRDREKHNIMKWVKSGHMGRSSINLQILAIVGMGGIGKTTLAQSVFEIEKNSFDLCGWVHCSSETVDAGSLLKTILSRFGKYSTSDTSDLEELTTSLEEVVCDKKFLLIIDDVWNKRELRWDELLTPLMGGKMGSRLIITTRDMQDVDNIDKCRRGVIAPPIELPRLREEHLWKILKDHAFGVDEPRVPTNVERMGKKIVKKLQGLPLAAKAVGCLLGPEQSPKKWKEIMESDLWDVLKSEGHVNLVPALILSFLNLPHRLKPCFKYCSLLNMHGRQAVDRKLVYQWLAHDYLQVQDNQSVEDVGAHIINHLKSMSLLNTVNLQRGRNRCVQMHDLIHDMSRASGTHDYLQILDNGDSKNQLKGKSPRHLSICVTQETSLDQLGSCTKLRTLILFRCDSGSKITSLGPMLKELKSLRVLTLVGLGIGELPKEIGELKQLRYLDLSGNHIKCLPPRMGELNDLQTLILLGCGSVWHSSPEQMQLLCKLSSLRHLDLSQNRYMKTLPCAITQLSDLRVLSLAECYELEELPEGISNLERLECLQLLNCESIKELPNCLASLSRLKILNIERCDKLKTLPSDFSNLVNLSRLYVNVNLLHTVSGIGKLSLLTILDEFCVQEKQGHKIDELANLNMLCGKLRISGLEYVKSKAEAQQSQLEDKIHIKELVLLWSGPDGATHTTDAIKEEDVIEGLKPKVGNLLGLTVKNYMGRKLPSWFNSQHLSQNKHIIVWNCPNLNNIPALPLSLERLTLNNVGQTEIPQLQCQNGSDASPSRSQTSSSIAQVPSLTYIKLKGCPSLLSLNTGLLQIQLPNLRHLIIKECRNLQHPLHNGFMGLESLETLKLIDCPSLSRLSTNSNLALPAYLRELTIVNCANLQHKPVLESVQALTSLRTLQLENCCCCMSKSFIESAVAGQLNMIERCTISLSGHHIDMTIADHTVFFKEKTTREIEDCCSCSELLAVIVGSIPSSLIDSMCLQGRVFSSFSRFKATIYCVSLESLPVNINRFSSLRKLFIHSLEYFSPQDEGWSHVEQGKAFFNLESVQKVRLANCKALKSLPYSFFLQWLKIKDCPGIRDLDSLGGPMPYLRYLCISHCENLENPPKQGFTNFISLEMLILTDCPMLSNLSLEEVPCDLPCSLETLVIQNCKDLPIGHIEEHISQLTTLEMLLIRNCGGQISKSFVKRMVILFGPRYQFKCRLISTEFAFQWLYTDHTCCSVVSWMVKSNMNRSEDGWDSLEFLVEMLDVIMSTCSVRELNISGINGLEAIQGICKGVLCLTSSLPESIIANRKSIRSLSNTETEKMCRQLCILHPNCIRHGIVIEGNESHDEKEWAQEDEQDWRSWKKVLKFVDDIPQKKKMDIPSLWRHMSIYENINDK